MESFWPQPTYPTLALTGFQLLLLAGGMNEAAAPTGYSKFAATVRLQLEVPQRVGMLVIYAPALIYSLSQLVGAAGGSVRLLTACCLVLHFGKRCLEVLFLHVFSGKAGFEVVAPIGAYYAFLCWLILRSTGDGQAMILWPEVMPGLGLFAVGQLGNLYHHWLLVQMRTKPTAGQESKGRYVIPRGALFDFVTMPHYFCELIAWYGLSMAVPRLNILLVATDMTSYLAGRSVSTTRWYQEKFGSEWPAARKHMIPYVF
ncbi:unnamed protein product [Polarella glacialis]|uniref:3-oxo-5-alpha-steroid 4-dehydrogenase C-terminal domain-containing protein n=1 Tax=Polarella glacialis TaxID=89957 RepID=A0A813KNH8_POLGL|nr:unnamed protein product [Polarella glacialis]|mmetsp:Transcript_18027/g.28849  ORF Transcript_18027/g.28849 Transcript_18027/m.28849 type:complete len:258 (-) Transcript_18027:7-780(-)|eukprot:CAMPEP_0115050442 /NCGR_PEP_ID=MMETSP0227-20121206/1783_1 /TAXON_ID=89957 /ORGANISM="Polarella glacialis, Strain CCMP 1383" /LENGTH=257 /DNA_ID=CAMNT_0002434291 /DNA_START=90 /DNA_END=863 /DNA_ORIENTATION=-